MAICWWQQAEVVGAVYWFCSSKETLPFFSSFGLRLGHGNGWAKLLAIKRAHQAITFQIGRTQVSGWLYIAMLPATYNLLTPSHHHPPAQTLIWKKKKKPPLCLSTFTNLLGSQEKEMATHSGILAWRIPGMGEPGGLPSMGSHRLKRLSSSS